MTLLERCSLDPDTESLESTTEFTLFVTEEYAIEPVRIYPNSDNGTFSFEGINSNDLNELRICNMQSVEVYYEKLTIPEGSNERTNKDLSFLPPGIYFIVLSKKGVKATRKKVMLS
jgi:hypothetical protein